MVQEGFVDALTRNSGKTYELPDSEYTGSAANGLQGGQGRGIARGQKFADFVTKSTGRTWEGLDPAWCREERRLRLLAG